MELVENFVDLLAKLVTWPVAAIIITAILVVGIRRIANAFRRLPIIRKIKVYGVEFELDESALRDLKKDTDETFKRLISEADDELKKFADFAGIFGAVEAAANNVMTNRETSAPDAKEGKFRATLHIPDPIFVDQLYQLTPYFFPADSTTLWRGNGGPGRRFSIRYGIIGLAARSKNSKAEAKAFQGTDEVAKQELVERWSMLPAQTVHAINKPSCLAVVLKDPETDELLGILYADAEEPDFFGCEVGCAAYAVKCEGFEAVQRLSKRLIEFRKLSSQIAIKFDLVRIGN